MVSLISRDWVNGISLDQVHAAGPDRVCYVSGAALVLMNVQSGEQQILETQGCFVGALAVNAATGLCVYSESIANPRLYLVDLPNQRLLGTLQRGKTETNGYTQLALSGCGQYLATIEEFPTYTLTVWSVQDRAVVAETALPRLTGFTLSFNPSTWTQLFSAAGAQLSLWAIEECRNQYFLAERTVTLPRVALLARRSSLLGDQHDDDDLKLPHLRREAPLPLVTSHTWTDHDEVLCACRQGEVFVVSTENENEPICVGIYGAGHTDCIATAGQEIVLAGRDGMVRWLERSHDEPGAYIVADFETVSPVSSVVVLPNALVIAGPGHITRLPGPGHNTPDTKREARVLLSTHATRAISSVGLLNDFLVTHAKDGFRVWRAETGALVSMLSHDGACSVAYHPAQPLLAAASAQALELLALTAGNTLQVVSSSAWPESSKNAASSPAVVGPVRFDASGCLVLVARNNTVLLFNLTHGVVHVGTLTVAKQVLAVTSTLKSDGSVSVVVATGDKGQPTTVTVFGLPKDKTLPLSNDTLAWTLGAQSAVSFVVRADLKTMEVCDDHVFAMSHSHRSTLQFPLQSTGTIAPSLHETHLLRGGAALAASVGAGPFAVSGGADGRVVVLHEGPAFRALAVHNSTVTSLCLDELGGHIFSVAADGVLACTAWTGAAVPRAAVAATLRAVAEATCNLVEAVSAAPLAKTERTSHSSVRAAPTSTASVTTLAKVEALRKEVTALISRNAAKPAIEQLDRDELAIDVARRDRLLQQQKESIAALREEIGYLILGQQFLRSVVKAECWDAMEAVGRTLYGFAEKVEVSSYPLLRLTAGEKKELAHVLLHRKIEIAEQRSRSTRVSAPRPAPVDGTAAPSLAATQDVKASGADDDEEIDETPTLYPALSLVTVQRKRDQIVLLRNQIREMKLAFNAQFDELFRAKEEERVKITERNGRIAEILAELKTSEPLYDPPTYMLEHPAQLLEVKDSEVTVPRVLSEEEVTASEVARKKEAERLAAESKDNPRLRGLQQMMDGRLEAREGETLWIDLVPPAFMSALQPADWTEEEKKVAADFDKAKKDLMEERDKRRKALDGELRKLQETIKAGCDAFDARLLELFRSKIATEQSVTCEELRMLKLVKCIQDETMSLSQEQALRALVIASHEARTRFAPSIHHARKAVADCQAEYDALVAQDKQLEKGFRTRREFADCGPIIDILFKLFKKRPKRHITDFAVPPLDKATDCPEGLDDSLWNKVVELRQQKIESESALRFKMSELADLTAFLNKRLTVDEELSKKLEETQVALSNRAEQRVKDQLDLELIVLLKQGQVEVQVSNDFDPNFASAMLIPRSIVEDLNASLRKLAQAKVAHLKQRMQLRKGIHALEWEHRRLDLEMDDIVENTKEVQLMRVTRDIAATSGVSEEDRMRKEVELLTKTIGATEHAHALTVAEKRKAIARLRKSAQKLTEEMEALHERATAVGGAVAERQTIHRVQQSIFGDGGKQKRIQELAAQRRLADTVTVQSGELTALRDELERLRMRTFPAFGRTDPRLV